MNIDLMTCKKIDYGKMIKPKEKKQVNCFPASGISLLIDSKIINSVPT
jgi:hypothetical protein